MDGQRSSKRLLLLVFLISLANFLLVLDMKVTQFSGLNQTALYIDAQKQLRGLSESMSQQASSSENRTAVAELSRSINNFNQVMDGSELIDTYGLTTVLVFSLVISLISAFSFIIPGGNRKWFRVFDHAFNHESCRIKHQKSFSITILI